MTGPSRAVEGDIRVMWRIRSPRLRNTRDIHVYVPPSYRGGSRHYPVLYMHDGQNLFDAETSFAGEWHVDSTMERLAPEGLEAIVVAIPNSGAGRIEEYGPFRDARAGGGQGDAYLDFIVRTLKPRVDRRFRTRPERRYTGIMGSSMGGLISLYGFIRHPTAFGFVGAMSPSIWFANRALLERLAAAPRWTGRVYLDIGTAEGARHVRNAREAVAVLERRASRGRGHLLYVEDPDATHGETAWATRFEHAFRFLLTRRRGNALW